MRAQCRSGDRCIIIPRVVVRHSPMRRNVVTHVLAHQCFLITQKIDVTLVIVTFDSRPVLHIGSAGSVAGAMGSLLVGVFAGFGAGAGAVGFGFEAETCCAQGASRSEHDRCSAVTPATQQFEYPPGASLQLTMMGGSAAGAVLQLKCRAAAYAGDRECVRCIVLLNAYTPYKHRHEHHLPASITAT
jgi:hypothetical protein